MTGSHPWTICCVEDQERSHRARIGADFKLLEMWNCRFRINASMNVGVLYNHVELDMTSSVTNDAVCAEYNEVAFLGEAALTAKLRLTDHLALRGGYQILGIHGVGVAADQLACNDIPRGPAAFSRVPCSCTGRVSASSSSGNVTSG